MAHLGFYLCLFGLLLSGYSMWVSCMSMGYGWLGSRMGSVSHALHRSSYRAMWVSCASVVSASLILWILLWQRDYSVEYIFKNSSDDLPLFYTITAFWSSLEGSHLFWSLILALIGTIAISTVPRSLKPYAPYLHMFISGVMVWMYLLLVSYSDPFRIELPPPPHGMGMNALLQNPYMAIHPPLLFLGYTSLVVPYAYGMAALCHGAFLPLWSVMMRRWTLVAWIFLTLGLFLGGRWAYVELGWGGYWAWDPVENSSFIPWLLTTALIHGCVIQSKTRKLSKINILLSILAFFFSFFGTFLTRSGIVVSVHSFAQSSIGKVYVVFLAVLFGLSMWIFLLRNHRLSVVSGTREIRWRLSRELMMVGGMFVLVVLAAVVSLGTLYPIISEMIGGVKVNVQAPYFNTFAPWFGGALATLMAFGALLRYHQSSIFMRWTSRCVCIGAAVICAWIFSWVSDVFASSAFRFSVQFIGSSLVFFTALCLCVDVRDRFLMFMSRFRATDEAPQSSVVCLFVWFKKNISYVGGVVAHLGFLVALLGFLGNYSGVEKVMSLQSRQPVSFMNYSFEYLGMDEVRQDNATLMKAVVMVRDHRRTPAQLVDVLGPARSSYPTSQELLHEVDVLSGVWHDLYLVLADHDQDAVSIKLYYNPLVKLVWLSMFLLVFGGVLSLFQRVSGSVKSV